MSNPELTPKQIKPENIISIDPEKPTSKSDQAFLDFLEKQYLEDQEELLSLQAEADRWS